MGMNPRLLRPLASGFDPRRIANIALWLDAADATTVSQDGSNNVETWSDKSGNGKTFSQLTPNNRPSYTATLNGQSVVTFDGSNDQLTNASNIINFANMTMFAVGQRNSGSFGGYITSMDSSAGGDVSPAILINVTNVAVRGDGTTGALATGSGGFFGPSVITGVVNNWAPSLFLGGTFIQSQAAGGVNSALNVNTAIGTYRLQAANYLNGYIAELICYQRVLSTAEQQQVERYLGRKWGLTVA
jgi:hypothetical protein